MLKKSAMLAGAAMLTLVAGTSASWADDCSRHDHAGGTVLGSLQEFEFDRLVGGMPIGPGPWGSFHLGSEAPSALDCALSHRVHETALPPQTAATIAGR